jgi:steroid 5-alpha reductase family enzyme
MKSTLNDTTRLILAYAFGDNFSDRSLVVFSEDGLNNRLKVLTSGLALAPNRFLRRLFEQLLILFKLTREINFFIKTCK